MSRRPPSSATLAQAFVRNVEEAALSPARGPKAICDVLTVPPVCRKDADADGMSTAQFASRRFLTRTIPFPDAVRVPPSTARSTWLAGAPFAR